MRAPALAFGLGLLILSGGLAAQSIRTGGGGGVASSLVCLLSGGAGCTMTGQTVYSNVATDITTGTNEDLTLSPNGTGEVVATKQVIVSGVTADITAASAEDLRLVGGAVSGSVQLQSTDEVVDILGSDGTVEGVIDVSASTVAKYRGSALGVAGSTGARSGTQVFFGVDEGSTRWLAVYGSGIVLHTPGTARTITATDTTSSPMDAGTACRMSAAQVSTWTPSESSAADGMKVCCTNTGTNDITMTDSDGVYEGPGSVVGQWDTVCFEYVTDRWVERSFSNNEP